MGELMDISEYESSSLCRNTDVISHTSSDPFTSNNRFLCLQSSSQVVSPALMRISKGKVKDNGDDDDEQMLEDETPLVQMHPANVVAPNEVSLLSVGMI